MDPKPLNFTNTVYTCTQWLHNHSSRARSNLPKYSFKISSFHDHCSTLNGWIILGEKSCKKSLKIVSAILEQKISFQIGRDSQKLISKTEFRFCKRTFFTDGIFCHVLLLATNKQKINTQIKEDSTTGVNEQTIQ